MTVSTPSHVIVLDGTVEHTKHHLGGKAWGINRMMAAGVPVPPAVVIPTDVCALVEPERLPDRLMAEVQKAVAHVEQATGRTFGAGPRPLLVSVRSGAAQSMPGMMDTVLNLGLTDHTAAALLEETGDDRWVRDVRRRFEEQYLKVVTDGSGAVPSDAWEQLESAILAVFRSWSSARALAYRKHHGLDDLGGTAVTIQAMVFGNADDASGTGVLFTRNPLTGEPAPYGEWLERAQGEDVVAGTHTPANLTSLAERWPELHEELLTLARKLEADASDVQDIEFTIESGRLWILQTRDAKRSPQAAVEIARQLADEGVISRQEALRRVTREQVEKVASTRSHAVSDATVLARGECACPGRASGRVVTDADLAAELGEAGEAVVLVRPTTTTDDVHGMLVAAAVVTAHGGTTSHAALVSRELGIPCVVGCGDDVVASLEGLQVTVDGAAGTVVATNGDETDDGEAATGGSLDVLVAWAKELLREDAPDDATPSLLIELAQDKES